MRYHNITHDDMKNGVGLRVVLWVAGCPHGCYECHNPETWSHGGGIPFDDEARLELFRELAKPHINGITISGGDPLSMNNRNIIKKLLSDIKIHYPNKSVWVYTGYVYEDILDGELKTTSNYLTNDHYNEEYFFSILQNIDVLVDGPYVKQLNDGKSLQWVGSSNQRVIDIKKTQNANNNIVLYNYEGE